MCAFALSPPQVHLGPLQVRRLVAAGRHSHCPGGPHRLPHGVQSYPGLGHTKRQSAVAGGAVGPSQVTRCAHLGAYGCEGGGASGRRRPRGRGGQGSLFLNLQRTLLDVVRDRPGPRHALARLIANPHSISKSTSGSSCPMHTFCRGRQQQSNQAACQNVLKGGNATHLQCGDWITTTQRQRSCRRVRAQVWGHPHLHLQARIARKAISPVNPFLAVPPASPATLGLSPCATPYFCRATTRISASSTHWLACCTPCWRRLAA